jgi:hypothetical protein
VGILIATIAKRDMRKNASSAGQKYFYLFNDELKIDAMYRNELLDDIINMVKLI